MQKTFVDANIVAEILFNRPRAQDCQDWLGQDDHWLFISALTVHIIYYLAEKYRQDPRLTKAILEPYLIVPIDQRVVELAQNRFTGRDFEDCLQAAAAELAGCQQILSLDQQFAARSHPALPVIHP